MTDEQDAVRRSKTLSRLLRHRPDIPHDREGWFLISDISSESGMGDDEILHLAATNTRYEVSRDGTRIRAYHGHSIDVDYGPPIVPPDELYHGTSTDAWAAIRGSGGILPMRRGKVHLTSSLDYARRMAYRHSRTEENMVILVIDSGRMHDDGHAFYRSGDGTYLTDIVPIGYVSVLRTALSGLQMVP